MTARLRPFWPVLILALLLLVPKLGVHIPVLFDGPINRAGNLQLLAVGFAFGIAALSYNLLFGYTGILSFGHALFFGAGVYLPVIAMRRWQWAVGPALLFTLVATLLLAVAIGALALRTQGVYFAMVTLAFAQAGAVVVGKNPGRLTGGEEGLSLPTKTLPKWMVGVVHTGNLYWLTLGALIVIYLVTLRMTTSPTGHIWEGIRENERRVEMIGLRPYTYKLVAFVVAAVIAMIGGNLYLFLLSGATPATVRSELTVTLLLMVIIGGSGALWGPVAGAMLYHYLNVRLTTWAASGTVSALPGVLSRPLADPLFILGIIFILLVLFFPRGIAGSVTTWRLRSTRKTAGDARIATEVEAAD